MLCKNLVVVTNRNELHARHAGALARLMHLIKNNCISNRKKIQSIKNACAKTYKNTTAVACIRRAR